MTVIGTNTASLRAGNASNSANMSLQNAMERLSTGKRINSAKDDAAGLAISSRMTSQVRSMAMAVRNANDGVSMAQTAEGALSEVTSMLQRMKELSTQAANGTLQASDRASLQAEVKQLSAEIDNVSNTATFNGVKLLDTAKTVKLQTGINSGEQISMSLVGVSGTSLGLSKTVGAVNNNATLNLNNVTGGMSVKVNGSTITAATSAKDAAKAITTSDVTATAANSITLTYAAPTAATTITVNGTQVDLAAADTVDQAITKINTKLAAAGDTTGLSVTNVGGKIKIATNGDALSVTSGAAAVFTGGLRTDGTTALTAADLTGGVTQKGTLTLTTSDASGKIAVEDGVDGGTTNLAALGISGQTTRAVSIASADAASSAMAMIDAALDKISAARGDLGAVQNRLQSTVNNLTTATTNLSDAKSRVEDADFSVETAALAKAQILSQASTAMLAQANQSQQGVLKLLQ